MGEAFYRACLMIFLGINCWERRESDFVGGL